MSKIKDHNKNKKEMPVPKNIKECVLPAFFGLVQSAALLNLYGQQSIEQVTQASDLLDYVNKVIKDVVELVKKEEEAEKNKKQNGVEEKIPVILGADGKSL